LHSITLIRVHDLGAFAMELSDPTDPNVRASKYLIAWTVMPCPHCSESTRLVALALPQGHEVLDAETESSSSWQPTAACALLFYVSSICHSARTRLLQLFPSFHPDRGEETSDSHWVNHCEHCNQSISDDELHCEPEGAFLPAGNAQGSNIFFVPMEEAFEASAAGYSLEPEFFQFERET
jgi:hypothetical protein